MGDVTLAIDDTRALVTPDKRVVRFRSRAEFDTWADGDGHVLQKHRGNIRQLLGYDPLPSDREKKHEAHGHFLLTDTTWMFHDNFSVAVPLFGSDGQKLSQLAKLATLKMKIATFRTRVANPGTRSKCGWWCGSEPPAVQNLPDGTSLFNLPASAADTAASLQQLPDFAVALGAREVTGFHHLTVLCDCSRSPWPQELKFCLCPTCLRRPSRWSRLAPSPKPPSTTRAFLER
jgi:hypothetical protein